MTNVHLSYGLMAQSDCLRDSLKQLFLYEEKSYYAIPFPGQNT